jgi:hypothetical protein
MERKTLVKPPCEESRKTLLDTTILLLKHRDRTITYRMISEATGSSEAFLSSLVSSSPPTHPSVDSIQRLYEFLTGKPLQY